MQGKQKGSSAAHTKLLKESLVAIGKKDGIVVFRNEVGEGWFFPPYTKEFYKEDARYLRYGLAPDTPDAFGFQSLIITQEMVGQRIAQAIGYEFKTGDAVQTVGQKNFQKVLESMGGRYKVIRSVGDL